MQSLNLHHCNAWNSFGQLPMAQLNVAMSKAVETTLVTNPRVEHEGVLPAVFFLQCLPTFRRTFSQIYPYPHHRALKSKHSLVLYIRFGLAGSRFSDNGPTPAGQCAALEARLCPYLFDRRYPSC